MEFLPRDDTVHVIVSFPRFLLAYFESTTTYTYEWYQGAVQTGITYKEGSATRLTTFNMANIAGQMVTKSVLVNDGRPRTVTFDTDVSGQSASGVG